MFKKAIVVFLKEMKDLLRDKKTFFFGLIIPIMLIPTMLFIIDYSFNSSQGNINDDVFISVSSKENSFYEFCKAHDSLKIVDVEDAKSALDSGRISAYIKIEDNMDQDIIDKKNVDLDIDFATSSLGSMLSIQKVIYYKELYLTMAKYLAENAQIKSVDDLRKVVGEKEINEQFSQMYPYQEIDDMQIDTSSLYFNMLVPMMLILYCCIGSASTASDISAGEKERGTLEALLSTGANRMSIIVGKLLATTAMGLISGLCTVIGLYGYLLISKSGDSSVKISFYNVIALLVVTLFTSMFFAAVNLTIGVYSKSSKEAQTYLMPVSIISLIPTYFTYSMDINSINMKYLCIPVMNIVCIIKEILAGVLNVSHLGIVVLWLSIYIAIAFSLTVSMFKKESVVFRI